MADRARRSILILSGSYWLLATGYWHDGRGASRSGFRVLRFVSICHIQWLRALGAVAIDCYGLESLPPRFNICLGDFFDRGVIGQIYRFGNRTGDERLRGSHHLDMTHVVDGTCAFRWLEAAVEHRQVFVFETWRAFDGACSVDIADDRVRLLAGVAELEKCSGDGIVDDLDHAATHQLFVFDESQIGLDAGGIAVHHEPDGSRRRKHRDLRVAVAVLLAMGERVVPNFLAGFNELRQLLIVHHRGPRGANIVH